MKITIFGATGNVGRRVVAEAIDRGHSVTAVARTVNGHNAFRAQVTLQKGDISKIDDVVAFSAGRDVVINATRPAGHSEAIQSTTRLPDRTRCRRSYRARRSPLSAGGIPARR